MNIQTELMFSLRNVDKKSWHDMSQHSFAHRNNIFQTNNLKFVIHNLYIFTVWTDLIIIATYGWSSHAKDKGKGDQASVMHGWRKQLEIMRGIKRISASQNTQDIRETCQHVWLKSYKGSIWKLKQIHKLWSSPIGEFWIWKLKTKHRVFSKKLN